MLAKMVVNIVISFFIFLSLPSPPLLTSKEKNTTLKMSGVIDRIEDNGITVILIPDNKEQIMISTTMMPKDSKEGMWVQLLVTKDCIIISSIDKEITSNQFMEKVKIQKMLQRK